MNIINRRSFLTQTSTLGMGAALASLVDIPLVMKRALAEGTIGQPGPNGRVKKLFFIFLRGANDGLNTVVPLGDTAYNATNRKSILIESDPGNPFTAKGRALFPESGPTKATFDYNYGLSLGNGFAGLHPALKFLSPIYNAGDLAVIHRVGYPRQSRSHFDSQNYWENGAPNNNQTHDGLLYRAMIESGLANKLPLTAVSIGSSLPLILRGSKAAMTNLNDPTRYNLLAVPNTAAGNAKADAALAAANAARFADKRDRELLTLQYQNLSSTLDIFAHLDFSEAGNTFVDDVSTDGDQPYYLFPTTNDKNGGYSRAKDAAKYVVPTSAYGHFQNLKSAAMVLNKTSALVAGVSIDGWDTHSKQGGATGSQANLLRRVGWSMYALQKYFKKYADQCRWEDLVVVTLSEFGRTSIENSDGGTDHAEASAMLVAGGGIKGFQADVLGGVKRTGVFNCGGDADPIPWQVGPTGAMFQAQSRYLKRNTDYRSVLGKLIRDHLGATPSQLERIIPGYANPKESLATRGIQTADKTEVIGEPDLI